MHLPIFSELLPCAGMTVDGFNADFDRPAATQTFRLHREALPKDLLIVVQACVRKKSLMDQKVFGHQNFNTISSTRQKPWRPMALFSPPLSICSVNLSQ